MELTPSSLTYALRLSVTDTGPVNWTIYARADAAYFSAASGVKPCSDLLWRQNGSAGYENFSTLDSAVGSGAGDAVLDFDFKLITEWSDTPDSYGINIVYTIVQN